MEPITLILADDHRLVRDGIRSLLADVPDIRIVADVASGDELLRVLAEAKIRGELPRLIVVDVSMPSHGSRISSGLDAAARVHQLYPNVHILFLSMHEEAEYIITAMKTGALGYVLKSAEKEELVQAILTVAEGKRFVSNQATENIWGSFSPNTKVSEKPTAVIPTLTQREQEILRLVVEGLSTKLIAERLVISPRTVETHRTNIMQKLHVANTAELVRFAVQYDLVKAV